jgi:hypothetical protein
MNLNYEKAARLLKSHFISISIMKYFATLLAILVGLECQCQYNLPEDFAAFGCSIDYKSGKFGSAFLFSDSLYVYLVTANHMLYEVDTTTNLITSKLSGDSLYLGCYSRAINSNRLNKISIYLKGLAEAGLLFHDSVNDIAMIELAKINQQSKVLNYNKFIGDHRSKGVTINEIKDLEYFNNVRLGADVFLIGFPKSIGPGSNQYEIDKPLLCRGIIAAKNEKRNTLIINAVVYHGNSGGPVFAFFPSLNDFRLIGIVTQLIPFESPIFQGGKALKGVGVFNNSSYSVVVPVDFILPLLAKFKQMHEGQ